MPPKIQVLDEHTINKIAAGEVIENPSSVVKELVDNSIDSGATEICVEITAGGRQLIRVTDNGCGMSHDDAVLCLERHATSKIRAVEDILSINSMGFRGEAIPSIASISKFTLLTSPDDNAETGTMVIVEGGRILQVCEAARSQGTTIEVKSLFYNVPVRKKFQRSPTYDSNEILKMLSKLALANPSIKIELISNQKNTLLTKRPSGDDFSSQLSERVSDVLGQEFIDQCCTLEHTYDGFSINGCISLPANTRHNRTGQYAFVNGRPVFSPLIHNAIREGYSTTLPTNRHPLFVIHVNMPGELVDVNVHPQKKEVRIRQEQGLKRAIIQAVDKALHGSGIAPVSFEISPSTEFSDSIFERKGFGGVPTIHESMFQEPIPQHTPPPSYEPPPFIETVSSSHEPLTSEPSPQVHEEVPLFASEEPPKPQPIVIGTIPGFILLDQCSIPDQEDGGFFVVDQKAAHARVIFESLLKKKNDHAVETQQLLVPLTLDLTPEEAATLSANLSVFLDMGIDIKEFGKNSYVIESIPTILGNIDVQAFAYELIHSLQNGEHLSIEGALEKKLAGVASRLALSRQAKISASEAVHLVDQLLQCKSPYQSPTGKHTMSKLNQQELAKRFG